MAQALVRRALKTVFFLIIMFTVAHALGNPEIYINHRLTSWLARMITGDVNAESMYDAYFYIDVACVTVITVIIYLTTMMLIRFPIRLNRC